MTPFKIYTDKSSDFQCEIEVDGASLSEARARLVLSSGRKSVLFEGKISKSGQCLIDIPRTRGIFEEGALGDMSLEVIVEEEAYFQPWTGDFVVDILERCVLVVTYLIANLDEFD